MDIFVEQDGQRLGPFNIAQLGESLASAHISPESRAWIEGDALASTVDQLLAKAAPPPGTPPVAPSAQETFRRLRPQLRSFPPVPASPEAAASQVSNKLRPREDLSPIAQGVADKFRRSRRARISEIPKPTVQEQLRFVGAATPLLIAFVLFSPWISGTFLPGDMHLSGYKTFDLLGEIEGYRHLFVGTFAIGTLGIGWFSFKGGLDGGSITTAPTFASAFFAVGSLFLLHQALPEASRTVQHLGGPSYAFATLLIGAAFGMIPGQDASPGTSVFHWIIVGVLAVAGFSLFLVGAGMGR
jgi:hypothetical protein